MVNVIPLVATATAVILFLAALVTLSMELYVVSGTFFMFTSFAIYIRERYK